MNDLNEILDINEIDNILNYFSGNSLNDQIIFNDYIIMINILSTNNFENIKLFFEQNNIIINFINNYFQKKIYPIYYLFSNPNLNIEIIEFILSLGTKLSFDNEDKSIVENLLNNADITDSNVLQILQFLKEKNYDFNKCNIHYILSSSLHMNNDIFNMFKGKEYDKNIYYNSIYDTTPLLISTGLNNTIYANLLLDCEDCNVNKVNNNNNTALMYACMNNNLVLINKLIERGADPNVRDNQGDVAFFYSCGCDTKNHINIDVVKHLYSLGFDIHQKSEDDFTAIHYASGCFKEIYDLNLVIYLIEIGIDTECIDKNGKTFLDYLIKFYDKQIIFDKLIKNINLGINLKNSIVINNLDYNICNIEKVSSKEQIKCNILHSNIESGDCFYKCEYNHCFDKNVLLQWYQESKKYKCPLCMNVIDLSKVYIIN